MNWDLRRATIILFVAIGTVFFCWMVSGFIATLLFSLAFSLAARPVVDAIHTPRFIPIRIAAIITILLFIVLLGIPTSLFVREIYEQAKGLQATIPFLTRFVDQLFAIPIPEWVPFETNMEDVKQQLKENLGNFAETILGGVVKMATPMTKGVVVGALNFFIFVYSSFFFLTEGDAMMKTTYRFLPFNEKDEQIFSRTVNSMVRSTLKSILIIGVVQALFVYVGFLVTGIPNALFWSSLVVVTSAIPGLGAPVVWWPAVIYLFANNQPGWAIALTIWGLFAVGWVDNILRPRIISMDTSMPDLYIFLSTIGGIIVFGPLGLVAGPMLAAVFAASLSLMRTSFFEKDESESGKEAPPGGERQSTPAPPLDNPTSGPA